MSVVEELIRLSLRLGDPSLDLAILAEGNASAIEGDSFWVKASGYQLASLDESGLAKVDLAAANAYLSGPDLTDKETREALKTVGAGERLPSVETFMHAYLLTLPGVKFVGHTHPTPHLSMLSTSRAAEIAKQRLFPDEIVCCGPESAFVPYTDPGLPLAKAIRASVEDYIGRWEETPKAVWLENHGLIALGQTAQEVLSTTLMSSKAARVWLHGFASGLPMKPLTDEQIERIHTRPDEHYRQELLRQLTGNLS
jgi:L-ribulose-5-phosphate 4-epimerase